MNRVDGKVAIVTGGGSGIGEATAELLASAGAKVVVGDINTEAAENTAKKINEDGGVAVAFYHDVSSEESWKDVLMSTEKAFGQLDILVNNAGSFLGGECKEGKVIDWQRVINVNLLGCLIGIRGAMNMMLEHGSPGSIINVSSGYGIVGGGEASYSASKGGVATLTKAMTVECGKKGYNIRFNTVHPGAIDTPVSRPFAEEEKNRAAQEEYSKLIPMGHFGEAIDIANGILFLASDDARYITGTSLVIDGGYTAA